MKCRNCNTRLIRVWLLNIGALSLFLGSFPCAVRAQDTLPQKRSQVHADAKTQASLYAVTFKTPQGQIRVFLPADMRPGDSLMATTSLEPKGRQEDDKESNHAQLSAYTLSFAGRSHSVQEPVLRWNLPADLKPDAAVLVLTNSLQQEVARAILPLQEAGNAVSAKAPGVDKINLPTKGQPGRPLVFNSSFPGGTDDLHVLVGEKEARLLAASPRVYVVESPPDVKGKTTLQVKQGSETIAEGKFSNNRASGGNPWPYILVVALGIGIYIAVQAAQFAHDFGNGFGSGGIF
jgi:hypothetical protein